MSQDRRLRIVAILLIGIGALIAVALHRNVNQRHDRTPELKKLIAGLEAECSQAVGTYQPTSKSRIDDLRTTAADVLRQLPGVVQVEVALQAGQPTHRIVHMRDWHFVPRELYALDSEGGSY